MCEGCACDLFLLLLIYFMCVFFDGNTFSSIQFFIIVQNVVAECSFYFNLSNIHRIGGANRISYFIVNLVYFVFVAMLHSGRDLYVEIIVDGVDNQDTNNNSIQSNAHKYQIPKEKIATMTIISIVI